MTFLNASLGFAVLTGPLWLILVLLFIAIWIAAKAVKRLERRGTKIPVLGSGLVPVLGSGLAFCVLGA